MSMKKVTVTAPAFNGVIAGSTATGRISIGRTIHQYLLAYAGATLAQLDAIRVVLNGEIIWSVTELTKLDVLNQFDGRAAAAGTLVLDFERFGIRDRLLQEMTAIGTGHPEDERRIVNAFIEIDINAAAVAPVLSGRMIQSAARKSGTIKKMFEYTRTIGGAGVTEIDDLPLKTGSINKITFGNQAVLGITRVRAIKDGNVIFDRTDADNRQMQTDGVRVPQAGDVTVDPSEDGYGDEFLVVANVNDLRWELTTGAGGTLPITVEFLAPINNAG